LKILVAGLGNIGEEYRNTRHNAGFMIVDYLAAQYKIEFSSGRYAFYTELKVKNKVITLIKPSTYMNLSGKAVAYWMKKIGVSIENLLVVVDDIALPAGKVRIKTKGGDGGHNGLIDITEHLNSNNFCRLRFGAGNDFFPGQQADYVLSKWPDDELQMLNEKIKLAADAVVCWALEGVEQAMTKFNNN